MKPTLKHVLLAAIPLSLAAPLVYADTTATGSASATIVMPLSVNETGVGLGFGSIMAGTSTGTVSTATKVASGGATLISGSALTSDTFGVTGNPSSTYTVSGSTSTTINAGSGKSMNVAIVLPSVSQNLGTTGSGSFSVDGVLTVGANQAPGFYTGSYNVNVSY